MVSSPSRQSGLLIMHHILIKALMHLHTVYQLVSIQLLVTSNVSFQVEIRSLDAASLLVSCTRGCGLLLADVFTHSREQAKLLMWVCSLPSLKKGIRKDKPKIFQGLTSHIWWFPLHYNAPHCLVSVLPLQYNKMACSVGSIQSPVRECQ